MNAVLIRIAAQMHDQIYLEYDQIYLEYDRVCIHSDEKSAHGHACRAQELVMDFS